MSTYSFTIHFRDKATATMNKVDGLVGRVTKKADGMASRFEKVGNNMIRLNQSAEFLERAGRYLDDAVRPGAMFQQQMADLEAITGITGDRLEELGVKARKSGKESGLGAGRAVEAYKLLASQISVDKVGIEGLNELHRETITLSHASGLAMNDSANAMAGTINQFGLQASEARRVINVMAAGAKYGAAEIPDLAQSFKVVGASASAAGLSVEQTAGAVEILSKANLKGAEAGTNLRNIIVNLQTKLGYDLSKTGMSKALQELQPRLQDTTFLAKTFGRENIAAAQFLIKNAGAVKEMTAKVTDTNVAYEQAAIRTDTFNHRMDVMKAKLEDVGIRLFNATEKLLPFVMLGTQGATAFTMFSPVMGGFGRNLGKVSKKLAVLPAQLKASTALTRVYGTSLKGATVSTNIFSLSLKGLKRAFYSVPIVGWIAAAVAAIVGLFRLLWKKSEKFRGVVTGSFAAVKAVFHNVGVFFKKVWKGVIQPVFKAVSMVVVDFYKRIIKPYLNLYVKIFSVTKDKVKDFLGWTKTAWVSVKEFFGKIWQALVAPLRWLKENLAAVHGWLFQKLERPVRKVFSRIKDFIKPIIETIRGWVRKLAEPILKMVEKVTALWKKIKGGVKKGWNKAFKGDEYKDVGAAYTQGNQKGRSLNKKVKPARVSGAGRISGSDQLDAGIPAMSGSQSSYQPDNKNTIENIASTGGKNVNVTFNMEKLQDQTVINSANLNEGLQQMEDRVLETLIRAFNAYLGKVQNV